MATVWGDHSVAPRPFEGPAGLTTVGEDQLAAAQLLEDLSEMISLRGDHQPTTRSLESTTETTTVKVRNVLLIFLLGMVVRPTVCSRRV